MLDFSSIVMSGSSRTPSPKPVVHRSEVLYSDEFCELSDVFIEVKRYFFPSMRSRFIRVNHITMVWFEQQSDAKLHASPKRKCWGFCKGKTIYWAADFGRSLTVVGDRGGKSDCVVETTDGARHGFTVRDAEEFLSSLRAMAPMSMVIVDSLNFE